MLQQLESLAQKAKITILVDKDSNGNMDVAILFNLKDPKQKTMVISPIFISDKPIVIDEKFNLAISKFLETYKPETSSEPVTEPKKEKVVSKAIKKEIVKEEPIRLAEMKPMPPPPTKHKAVGTLTAKLSEEEIEAIQDSYARPEPELRPRTPQEAFEAPQLFAQEEDWEEDESDTYMQNDDDLFEEIPEEEEFYENETKNFILEQAESKGIPKKMVEEKVIFATVPKPEPPIADMELQAKDMVEQMKKNSGENYLNRRGKLIIQQEVTIINDPIELLKNRWFAILDKAHHHGMKTDGLVFEQQTPEMIDSLEKWVNSRIEAQNK